MLALSDTRVAGRFLSPCGQDSARCCKELRGTELDYLVASRQGADAARAVLGYVASRVAGGRWEVPGIGALLLAAHAVLNDYPAIGLADAMNAVLAREFRTDVIATFDHRHFRVIRPLTRHSAFRLLPVDVPQNPPRGDRLASGT